MNENMLCLLLSAPESKKKSFIVFPKNKKISFEREKK